jgi:hypothetical protein
MNHDAPPPAEETSSPPFDESEVARVFDAYLAGLEGGPGRRRRAAPQ